VIKAPGESSSSPSQLPGEPSKQNASAAQKLQAAGERAFEARQILQLCAIKKKRVREK
jgi:hypothetical protein